MKGSFTSAYRKEGIKGIVKHCFQKMLKAAGYEDELNTLFYFLNKYVDISRVPIAEGALRDLQLCDFELMRILHLVCVKHNLKYWIDYGTLLGAVRHGGFIPWDDDMDVSMPRNDYEKALFILNNELNRFGIKAEELFPMWRIGLSYRHHETGIWIDIFPVDEVNMPSEIESCGNELEKRILRYRKYYHRHKKHMNVEKMKNVKKNIIFDSGEIKISYHNPEFMYHVTVMHNGTDIYPLQTISFESASTQFYVPKNLDTYLKRIYGSNYMSFPRCGVEHHGSNSGTLSNWASLNDVDMSEVKSYLSTVACQLEREIE